MRAVSTSQVIIAPHSSFLPQSYPPQEILPLALASQSRVAIHASGPADWSWRNLARLALCRDLSQNLPFLRGGSKPAPRNKL